MAELYFKNLINRIRSGITKADGGAASCGTKSQEIRNGTKHQDGSDEANSPAPTGTGKISTKASSSSIDVSSIRR